VLLMLWFSAPADTLRAAAAPPPESSRRPAAPMWGQVLDMLQETGCVGRELEVGRTLYICYAYTAFEQVLLLVCRKHCTLTFVCQQGDFPFNSVILGWL
jgi:hypothetical protein